MPKHSKERRGRHRSRSRSRDDRKKRRSRSSSDDKVLKKQVLRLQRRLEALEGEKRNRKRQKHGDGHHSGSSGSSPSRRGTVHYLSDDGSEGEQLPVQPQNKGGSEEDENNVILQNAEKESGPLEVLPNAPQPQVSEDVLALFGDEDNAVPLYGPPLNPELIRRWKVIIANGLQEDKRKETVEKYPCPSNFTELSPPILNTEVKEALNNSVVRRDERLSLIQKQVDATLSAIGLAITALLEKEGGGQEHSVLQPLCDAGRLLADLHFSETKSRRELALLNLDQQLKDSFINAPVTTHLFGENLDERVNAAKSLKKFSQALKPPAKPLGSSLIRKPLQSKQPLNYQSLSRPTQGNRQGRQHRYQQSPYNRPNFQQRGGAHSRHHQQQQQRTQFAPKTQRKNFR